MEKRKMTDRRMCGHPELTPTQWDQSRPEPVEMVGCACGQNQTCPVCGWGQGAYPCDCNRVKSTVDKYKTRFESAWQKMAEGKE